MAFKSSEEVRESEDFPDGTIWMCVDCDDGFVKSLEDLGAFYQEKPGAPIPCPKCDGTRTSRGKKCPHTECGKFYISALRTREQGKYICPRCKKELPSLHAH